MTLTKDQAALAIRALMPKLQALSDMLHLQIQTLPPGCDDWIDTQRNLRTHQEAVEALQGVGR